MAGWGGVGVVALGGNPFDDPGRSFALADLGAEVGPLAVGRPPSGRVLGFDGLQCERDGVGAAVAVAGGGVADVEQSGDGVPRHAPGSGAGLDLGDELGCDGGGEVGVVHW